jgi:hypothetical protein
MTPKRTYLTDEAYVVDLAQRFNPSLMPLYFRWRAIWRRDPLYGRGALQPPLGDDLRRGAGLFWDVTDRREGRVRCYLAGTVRARLEKALG